MYTNLKQLTLAIKSLQKNGLTVEKLKGTAVGGRQGYTVTGHGNVWTLADKDLLEFVNNEAWLPVND